jgi:hypothetical protein
MDGGWGMGFEAILGAQFNVVEGNFMQDVGQLVNFYKPAIELSEANNTVRRNVAVNAKSNGLEISVLYSTSSAANELVYNNVFYGPGSCIFQSANGGSPAYDGDLYANNVCYKFSGPATDIYQRNRNSNIIYNDILFVDSSENPQPDQSIIIWNHVGQGSFQYPQPLAFAEQNYNPPFANNKGLNVPPQFVDEAHFDFHLSAGSPLVGAGTSVTDPVWGSTTGATDVGAFGIAQTSTTGAPAAPIPIANMAMKSFVADVRYSQALVAAGNSHAYRGWAAIGNPPPGPGQKAGQEIR